MADIGAVQQNLTDIEELADQLVGVIVAGDALAVDLRAQIAGLVDAATLADADKVALAGKIDDAFAQSEVAENKLREAVPHVPPVGGVPLAVSFANQADFDAGIQTYTGPEAVTQDGTEKKAGTSPAIDFFTHSSDGSITTSGPTD